MIIKNGLVIDPASGLSEKMDLLIEDGIIKEMASLHFDDLLPYCQNTILFLLVRL